jgi:putative membrane-bound dehydrogenase-like protein
MRSGLPPVLVCTVALLTAAGPGGFTPQEAARRAKPADGLSVTLFAAEPNVRQPIFVKCDDRGRVWTIQYLQYPNPAGLKRVKVDRWSRTVYDRIPEPPPAGPKGADRITICEDTDADGQADRFTDFVQGLNLCTGVEFGHGGVFVLQAPYLLFYPDRNRDDVPDGNPEVLLSGFGMEDAQSLANHLTWGPDGWLYGLNGSTTTCRILGLEFQQGVWRYHPVSKEFELFCEGGGNVFGLTFDDDGNLFYSSNLGLFWHAHQGAYYFKSFGKHGPLHNPYAYGHLMHVAHDAPTGGPTTGGIIYRGDSFPNRFQGRFLAGDFLRHTASSWELKRSGVTVTASFRELLLDSRDSWFGATDLCLGPDGSVYLSDFHDKRTAHPDPDADWDRSNGRIFKLAATNAKPAAKHDLAKLTSRELVDHLQHPNGWIADRARVLLAEKGGRETWDALRNLCRRKEGRTALKGLWALHVTGGFDETTAGEMLKHDAEHVRAWTVRLLGDARKFSPAMAKAIETLATREPSPIVRAQLLCTAKRLPGEQAWPIIEQLLLRDTDAADPVVTWLTWWAIESHAIANRKTVVSFFSAANTQTRVSVKANLGRLVRRYAAEGRRAGYESAHAILTALPAAERGSLWEDLARGLSERAVGTPAVTQGGLFESVAAPGKLTAEPARKYEPLTDELQTLIRNVWRGAKSNTLLTRLAIRAGIREASEHVIDDLANPKLPRPLLMQRLAILEEFGDASCLSRVQPHLDSADAEVQKRVLALLARVGDAKTGEALTSRYRTMPAALQSRAREVLFGRKEWANAFLRLIDAGTVPPAEVPVEQVRLLALLEDATINNAVRKHWGSVKSGTPEEKLAEIRRFSNDLRAGVGDATRGRVLFTKHCGACHKLHGEGGAIGPDLTNTSRADTVWLLTSIVDPGAVVRAQYVQYAVRTIDDVLHIGIIGEQDEASITLIDGKGERTRLPRDRIDSLREFSTSLMPEKLLDALTPQERRDLIQFVQKPRK